MQHEAAGTAKQEVIITQQGSKSIVFRGSKTSIVKHGKQTSLPVCQRCLLCCRGYKESQDLELQEVFDRVTDKGLNLWDTADSYGEARHMICMNAFPMTLAGCKCVLQSISSFPNLQERIFLIKMKADNMELLVCRDWASQWKE